MLDTSEEAVKIAKSRFAFLKGAGVLERIYSEILL